MKNPSLLAFPRSRLYTQIAHAPSSCTGAAPQLHQSLPICAAPTNRRDADGISSTPHTGGAVSQPRESTELAIPATARTNTLLRCRRNSFQATADVLSKGLLQASALLNPSSPCHHPSYSTMTRKGVEGRLRRPTLASDVATPFTGRNFQRVGACKCLARVPNLSLKPTCPKLLCFPYSHFALARRLNSNVRVW